MPFTPQVTNNLPEAKVTDTLMNELAENDIYLKVRADTVDSDLGQPVNTTDDVTFNKVTTPTGDITTVSSTTGNITTVNSTTGNITTVNSTTGEITTVNSTTGNITTLNTGTINNSGAINPTTAPAESTTATLSTNGSTITIPRGIYSVYGQHIVLGASSLRLQRFINGVWVTISSTTTSSILGDTVFSSGSDLRLYMFITSGSASASAILRKY